MSGTLEQTPGRTGALAPLTAEEPPAVPDAPAVPEPQPEPAPRRRSMNRVSSASCGCH